MQEIKKKLQIKQGTQHLRKEKVLLLESFSYLNLLFYRSFHPYSFPGNKDTHGINTARTVEVSALVPVAWLSLLPVTSLILLPDTCLVNFLSPVFGGNSEMLISHNYR